ncbi:hypothetical protein [Wolbachia endosymbiont of Zygogramma bicolorata]|uniref:hypothetical protein n=1 Tax=Wolbachia endosymbiont of Zygogramma bicolorata TaxID=3134048 RepID=UPI003DA81343
MVNYNIYSSTYCYSTSFPLATGSTLLPLNELEGLLQQYMITAATKQQAPTAIPTANTKSHK